MGTSKSRLGVESLEDRSLMSASIYTNGAGDLVITGTSHDESIRVDPSNGLFLGTKVTDSDLTTGTVNVTYYLNYSQIPSGKVIYYAGAGNDSFVNNNPSLRSLVYGGEGNDVITGGSGDDVLYGDGPNYWQDGAYHAPGRDIVHGGGGTDTVYGGSGDDVVTGDAGDDWLYGDDGNDQITGGAGTDRLYGGWGNDTLTTIDGGTTDYADGQGDWDTAWLDENVAWYWWGPSFSWDTCYVEKGQNVEGFANGADRSLDGDAVADPGIDPRTTTGVYKNFRTNSAIMFGNPVYNPLFASGGPSYGEIRQGAEGDCWMLAKLGAVANDDPGAARSLVADFGDGTYGVRLGGNFYRVDADLPVASIYASKPVYAGLGAENSLWVAIIEKAYAQARVANGYTNNYRTLDGGWCEQAGAMFGAASQVRGFNSFSSATELANTIGSLWNGYNEVAVAWGDTMANQKYLLGGRLIDAHAYTVAWVNWDASGNVSSITLRNPWGFDTDSGAYTDNTPSDGFVTVTPAELYSINGRVEWGRV